MLFQPTRLVRRVSEIDLAWLQQRQIRGIVSDLDNTLAVWHEDQIEADILDWLSALKIAKISVCLCSNTRNYRRLQQIAERLGVFFVPGNAGKPGTRGVLTALELLTVLPNEAAMIGDQLFTDVIAGNRLGLTTILVNPLSEKEFIGTTLISRRLEPIFLRGEFSRPK
jgi:uncharacterized protein